MCKDYAEETNGVLSCAQVFYEQLYVAYRTLTKIEILKRHRLSDRPVVRADRSGSGFFDQSALLVELHPEVQTHRLENLLDLVQRFSTKILCLEHVRLGFLNKLSDRTDIGILQTVV